MSLNFNNEKNGPDSFSGISRRRDYKNSVCDYNTELYRDEKGMLREKAVYIGPMIPFIGDAKTVRRKLFFVMAISVVLVAVVLYAALCEHTTAWWGLTSIAMAVALFPCFALITGIVNLPFSAEPMKRDRYQHSIIRTIKSTAILLAFLLVEVIGETIYRFTHDDWMFLRDDIVFLAVIFAAIALSIGNILVLRSIDVDEREVYEFDKRMNL